MNVFLKGMLELSQKALSSRLTFCMKFCGWKLRVTHYCSMIMCIFCSSHYSHVWVGTEVNVQSQISSFISLDGIWKELVSWEKIISFFDHSNTCAGFQLVECSVSWEIALWFALWEPDWSFTWERICNPLSQEQPVL